MLRNYVQIQNLCIGNPPYDKKVLYLRVNVNKEIIHPLKAYSIISSPSNNPGILWQSMIGCIF